MATRKRPAKAPASLKKRTPGNLFARSTALRAAVGLTILILTVLLIGLAAERLLPWKMPAIFHKPAVPTSRPHNPTPPPPLPDRTEDAAPSPADVPIYEIFPPADVMPPVDDTASSPEITGETTPSGACGSGEHRHPRIVIIIDDIGHSLKKVDQLLALGQPLTFSVLPFSHFHRQAVQKIIGRHREVMLHLPMEPMEYPHVNPGPGALLTSMSVEEITQRLTDALNAVPQAVGVNNHMGSKFTAHSDEMYPVLSAIKQRGLFFIDSRTANKTVCRRLAHRLKLPFAQRTVFLDNQLVPGKIKNQLAQLVRLAVKHGSAIGIGHPHKETLRVLADELPHIAKKCRIVPASCLVHIPG